jgi:hypothetical protein
MKNARPWFWIVFCAFLICRNGYACEIPHVSVIQLIANPELFNEKEVRITGFLHLEFEGNAIYLHREDYEYSIVKNSLALDLTDQQELAFQKLNDHYVAIEGRFSLASSGHFGMHSGSVQNITRIDNRSVMRSQIAKRAAAKSRGESRSPPR